jgi:8-oxo-dGTP pyrophosphatase MutT (NUDIX family)
MSAVDRALPRRSILDPRHTRIDDGFPTPPAVPAARLSADALREHFRHPPEWHPEITDDRWRLDTVAPRAAAVLVPLVMRDTGLTVLLTERTAHLTSHAGQIAFPGGRTEPTDASPVATALRETEEEIGLPRALIEILGSLPPYHTGSGFIVTPVVGLVVPEHRLALDAHEVAEAFEVPLGFLMDPAHHQRRLHRWDDGAERSFFAMPWCEPDGREHFIWGVTAAMLRNLYRFLAA